MNGDRLFRGCLKFTACTVILILWGMGVFLFYHSLPALKAFGLHFMVSSDWDPVNNNFGAIPFIYGTLVSSALALLIAVPLGVGTGLFLSELAPSWTRGPVSFLVEMLAAVPSIVYGLWGLFVVGPLVRDIIEPALVKLLGWAPGLKALVSTPPLGIGMLPASIVLAIIVLPSIASLCREVFRAIPRVNREAALALGATRWESLHLAVLASSRAGIAGAVLLALGRAIGETMAVTMIIGNRPEIVASLFAPAHTMASVIANEYAEAHTDLYLSSLTEIGLVLFVTSFFLNAGARLIIRRFATRVEVMS